MGIKQYINRRITANTLIIMGFLLIILNILGFFIYTTVDNNDVRVMNNNKREVSEQQFWSGVYRENSETLENYVGRLTNLINKRMLFINNKYTKPTIFENMILWGYSKWLGMYEWRETKKAVRLGGGLCSQYAIILNNIIRSQGIESRILSLEGHVLNEILIEGKWRVYDAVFNIKFNSSLKDLINNHDQVYQVYKNAGLTEEDARYYQQAFVSEADNWHYRSSWLYWPWKNLVETAALYLIWIVPSLLIFMGYFLNNWKCIRLR